jgi:hypothetical protein
LLAGLGLVLLAGTACTTHAGAAAQVGSDTIETSTLRGIVDRGVAAAAALPTRQASQSLDRGELQRRTLSTLVQLSLIQTAARRLGVSVSPQDVDAYYQAYGVLQFGSVAAFKQRAAAAGFAEPDVRTIVLSGALESAIEDKIAPDSVAPEADIRAQYNNIVQQVGKLPLSYDQARPYLARFLAGDQRAAKLRPLLTETARWEHVSINPRFGTWDAKTFAVSAADGSIATSAAPVPTVTLSG